MSSITIHTTSDLSLETPVVVRDVLRRYVQADIDRRQMFFKSLEPPSWIAIIGDLSAWQLLLGAGAGLYLKEILKEAAKEHWRDRHKILNALKAAAITPIFELADAIARMRAACAPRTDVILVLSWPDDFHGTRLSLEGREQPELALQLAAFIANADRIQSALVALEKEGVHPLAPIQVRLLSDGVIELHFIDSGSHSEKRVRIPPNAA